MDSSEMFSNVYEGNSKSGYIMAMPLEDYTALVDENARLRAALETIRQIASSNPSGRVPQPFDFEAIWRLADGALGEGSDG